MFSAELPFDGDPIAVCAPIPGVGLTAQLANVSKPAPSQALSAEETDLHLGLIQPTSMSGRVVHRKAIPQPSTHLLPKAIGQGLAGMGAQIVDDQMNGVCCRIVRGDLQDEVGKLRR